MQRTERVRRVPNWPRILRGLPAFGLAAGILAACGPGGGGATGGTADAAGSTSDSATIAQRWSEYSAALTGGDAGKAAEHFTRGAELMEPGLATIRSRGAIRNAVSSALERVDVAEAEMRTREIHVHGDRAYEIGSYREEIRSGQGESRKNLGRYVAFWAREGGKWRIDRLMLNQLPEGREVHAGADTAGGGGADGPDTTP